MLDMTSVTKTRPRPRRWSAPRFRQPTIGLRWRLVFLVVATLSPALLLFLHHTQNIRAALLTEAQARALHLARSWAENHDAVLREANLVLEAALRDPAIATGAGDQCSAALAQLAARVSWSSALAVIDRGGTVLCTTEGNDAILSGLGTDYLHTVVGSRGLEVSEFRLDRSGHSFAIAGLRLAPPPGASSAAKPSRIAAAAG